jgi:hypothetical protein
VDYGDYTLTPEADLLVIHVGLGWQIVIIIAGICIEKTPITDLRRGWSYLGDATLR